MTEREREICGEGVGRERFQRETAILVCKRVIMREREREID